MGYIHYGTVQRPGQKGYWVSRTGSATGTEDGETPTGAIINTKERKPVRTRRRAENELGGEARRRRRRSNVATNAESAGLGRIFYWLFSPTASLISAVMTKYILVSGGVVSGIGKGIIGAM